MWAGRPPRPHCPLSWAHARDGLVDETCSSFRPETCWWGEGSPQGSQTSGRQAAGAEALLPLLVSQAGPGPSEVLWFSLVPALPSEPSPPPHPTPLPPTPRRAPPERPWTEHLVAIQGEVPGARPQEGSVVGRAGSPWPRTLFT